MGDNDEGKEADQGVEASLYTAGESEEVDMESNKEREGANSVPTGRCGYAGEGEE